MNVRISFVIVVFFCATFTGCVAFVFDGNPEIEENPQNSTTTKSSPNFGEGRWISQLFLKAQMSFDMHPHVNSRCKKDFESYKSYLQNETAWAIRSKCQNYP